VGMVVIMRMGMIVSGRLAIRVRRENRGAAAA